MLLKRGEYNRNRKICPWLLKNLTMLWLWHVWSELRRVMSYCFQPVCPRGTREGHRTSLSMPMNWDDTMIPRSGIGPWEVMSLTCCIWIKGHFCIWNCTLLCVLCVLSHACFLHGLSHCGTDHLLHMVIKKFGVGKALRQEIDRGWAYCGHRREVFPAVLTQDRSLCFSRLSHSCSLCDHVLPVCI